VPDNITAAIVWGVLRFSDGSSYQLTADDMLWTARAVVYEGGPTDVTLWTLAQRFSQTRHTFSTFEASVRAFAQPVNPEWARDGKHCRPGGYFAKTAYCEPERLDRRDRAAASDWYDLEAVEPDVIATVIAWGQGRVRNPLPRATNFADPKVAAAYVAAHPGTKILLVADNWYLQDTWAKTWGRDRVVITGSDGTVANAAGVTGPGAKPRATVVTFLDVMLRRVVQPVSWRI
jgi:hypothetical protein